MRPAKSSVEPSAVIDEPSRSTRAYYQRHAKEYAAATLDAPMADLVGRFARGIAPGARVVDLGCGAGRDLRLLFGCGLDPIGIDLAEQLAATAQRHSGAPVVVGDLRQLPFADGAFDGGWAAASLLHLPRPEVSGALAEAFRVLRPGASFFASVKWGVGEGRDPDGRWFTYFNDREWPELLGRAGFKDVVLGPGLDNFDRATLPGQEQDHWLPAFSRKSR